MRTIDDVLTSLRAEFCVTPDGAYARDTAGQYPHPHDVLSLVRLKAPNVLLVGAAASTDAAFRRLRAWLATPLHTCVLPGPLRLPNAPVRTLVLRDDVATLSLGQQDELLRWLDQDSGRVHIVSIALTPLFHNVQRGAFRELLYYRLNTLTEEVDDLGTHTPSQKIPGAAAT